MSDTDAVSVARLIALVKERPVLWDRQEEVYKNRKLTRQAWAEICEALIDNYHDLGDHEKLAIGRSIIGKWANLRDNWLRYWRKRQELLRVGSSTKSLKKYIHHDQLLFLSKVYDPEGQQEVEEIQVEVDVISDPEFESTVEFDETSQNSWNGPQYSLQLAPHPQDQSERHLYFFQSIMPMICDFDNDQMLAFHAGVLECVKQVKHYEFATRMNCHLYCKPEVQEVETKKGTFANIVSDAATQSEYYFNQKQQICIKQEPNSDFSNTITNSATLRPIGNSTVSVGSGDILKNDVKQKVTFDESDFMSLKDVVSKLEKISGTFSANVGGDYHDQFGRNIDSLLKKLPSKKMKSLKRKIVKEVIKEGFKKIKVESGPRCSKTEISDSNTNSPPTSDVCERKLEAAVAVNSHLEERNVTPSILRDTLQNVSLLFK